jgi:hypothetical protein
MRKSDEMIRVRRFSLNSRMCLSETDLWLARTIPRTVTVRRPASFSIMFDPVKATATSASRKTGWR